MRTPLTKIVSSLLVISLLAGCSFLSPGKKEFFQKEVPSFPDKAKMEEAERAAAKYVKDKVDEAYSEGLKEAVPATVMTPLGDAKEVAGPLSMSLGEPISPWKGSADELSRKLELLNAKYEAKLKELEGKLSELEGKKIEGTGLIQMGYFSFLALLLVIGAGLWFILKIVSIFNPPVAVGTKVVGAGVNVLRKGFSEIIEAGENFKGAVRQKIGDRELQEQIIELFRTEQMRAQSRDVQTVVKELTNDPAKDLVKVLKHSSP